MTEYSTSIWSSNKFLVVRTVIRSFLFFPPATKRKQCFKCNVGKVVLQSSVDTTEYLLDLPHESERARKTLSIAHSSSLFLCHLTYHHERRQFLPLPYKYIFAVQIYMPPPPVNFLFTGAHCCPLVQWTTTSPWQPVHFQSEVSPIAFTFA